MSGNWGDELGVSGREFLARAFPRDSCKFRDRPFHLGVGRTILETGKNSGNETA